MMALDTNRVLLAEAKDLRKSLTKRTAKDIISDKIAALIASGVLHIDDELPSERELATSLDVSRETVRGAIQILAARGVVEVSQGARTRVISTDLNGFHVGVAQHAVINSYDLETIHATRLLIERQVVSDAAEFITDEALERLRNSLSAQAECFDDPVKFLICDREFHVTIYRACGNPLLADLVTDLYTYMMDYRRRVLAHGGAIKKSYQEHAAIVDALERHDRAAVLTAFGHHLDRIYTTTRSILSTAANAPRKPKKAGGDTDA
ncbi:FadR/GntR family transcriptional regulator [Dongia sp.]|uniref:FadR/GntR family transcriptional regulator n=1 Tax=Dongia sp. TaxID=1977262 RepID=UPI0035B3EA75